MNDEDLTTRNTTEPVEIAPGITVHPNIRFGKSVIRGRRIDVATIIGQMSAGASVEELMEGYKLTRQNVLDALAYAHKAVLKDMARIRRRIRRGIPLGPAPYESIDLGA